MKIVSSFVKQAEESGHDSITVSERNDVTLMCLSDGAGGMGGGLVASRLFSDLANEIDDLVELNSPLDFESLLRKIDLEISSNPEAGEATGIIAIIRNGSVLGASVGDSQCWLYEPDFEYELSKLQNRKPLLGSGLAVPVGFGPTEISGSLLLASDGLFNYVRDTEIKSGIHLGAESLVNLAEKAIGYLQDDCSVIIYRA